jgi:hypothetical protein
MQTITQKTHFGVVLMWTLALFPLVAHAGTLHVNCDSKKGLTRIQRAINILQQGGSEGSNTIIVSGSCKENITIQSTDNLTLTAENGASITDPSNGSLDVIDIVDSRRVSINGFTINGGAVGVLCGSYSLCRFSANTIQNSPGFGVDVSASQAAFDGDTLQSNASRGLAIVNGGQVGGVSSHNSGKWRRSRFGDEGHPDPGEFCRARHPEPRNLRRRRIDDPLRSFDSDGQQRRRDPTAHLSSVLPEALSRICREELRTVRSPSPPALNARVYGQSGEMFRATAPVVKTID